MFTQTTSSLGGPNPQNVFEQIKPEPGWEKLIDPLSKLYMPVTQFLLDNNLTYDISKLPHSPTYLNYEEGKESVLSPTPQPDPDKPTVQLVALPLPFTHIDFKDDYPDSGREAVQEVCLRVERMVVGSYPYRNVRGLLQAENAGMLVSRSLYIPPIWLRNAIQKMNGACHFGPFALVYDDMELGYYNREKFKKDAEELRVSLIPSRCLPTGHFILFGMGDSQIRLVAGLKLCVTQWEDHYKVVCMLVPQIKADLRGFFPVVHIYP